jgi:hypothetical protein
MFFDLLERHLTTNRWTILNTGCPTYEQKTTKTNERSHTRTNMNKRSNHSKKKRKKRMAEKVTHIRTWKVGVVRIANRERTENEHILA